MSKLYEEPHRTLQDSFGTRRLADRVEDVILHDRFADEDRAFIESRDMFFLSTVDNRGRPTVSYKGGDPGFVRVLDERTLAFPSYDGNGMFLSAGNVAGSAELGMLFIDFEDARRLRLQGRGSIDLTDPLRGEWHEAQLVVRVAVTDLWINCGRYIHKMRKVERSPYAPKPGCRTPVPEWKRLPVVQDVLPERDRERIAAEDSVEA